MNNSENTIAKDIFKFLGVIVVAIFSVIIFLFKVWAKSDNSELVADDVRQDEILQAGYSHPEHPQHNQYLIDMDIL